MIVRARREDGRAQRRLERLSASRAARAAASRGSRGRCRPPAARGDPDMTPTVARSGRRAASAAAPCVTSSFQAECVVLVHMLQRDQAGHPGAVPRYRSIISRRPMRIATTSPARWNLNLVNLRSERPALGLWQQDTSACCGTPQGRAAVPRAAGLRRVVHRPAAAAVAEPRQSPGDRAVRAADRQGPAQGQPAGGSGRRRTCGATPRSTTSRCCRSTTAAIPASAASRARRCRRNRANERSGRWGGQKLECGIHIGASK